MNNLNQDKRLFIMDMATYRAMTTDSERITLMRTGVDERFLLTSTLVYFSASQVTTHPCPITEDWRPVANTIIGYYHDTILRYHVTAIENEVINLAFTMYYNLCVKVVSLFLTHCYSQLLWLYNGLTSIHGNDIKVNPYDMVIMPNSLAFRVDVYPKNLLSINI